MTDLARVLVIIPTYNELENLPLITTRILNAVADAHILVVDDNSPDGTGALADEMAAANPAIHVLHRAGKQGLGAAYLAGFEWGLAQGFDVLIEHDADGSHQPEYLPSILAALEDADVVKGSRYIPGGSTKGWPWHRELLSRGGNLWTQLWLGLPVRDATGGLAAWRATTLKGMGLDGIEAAGYGFQVELIRRAVRSGYRAAEVPIEFVERELGASKMSGGIVIEAMALTTRWGIAYRLGQLRETFAGLTGRRQRSKDHNSEGQA